MWLVLVVYDGSKTVKGNMILTKISSEPTGGTENINLYRGVFKSSIVYVGGYVLKADH